MALAFLSGCSSAPTGAEYYASPRPIFATPTVEEVEKAVEIAKLRLQRQTIDIKSECVEKLMDVFRGSAGNEVAVLQLMNGLDYIMSSISPRELPDLPPAPQSE
jgi:hypothetical protein